ncbi:MAG: hypothetical protein QXP01_09645 [Candidatus Hadarchaeum sp.]
MDGIFTEIKNELLEIQKTTIRMLVRIEVLLQILEAEVKNGQSC